MVDITKSESKSFENVKENTGLDTDNDESIIDATYNINEKLKIANCSASTTHKLDYDVTRKGMRTGLFKYLNKSTSLYTKVNKLIC